MLFVYSHVLERDTVNMHTWDTYEIICINACLYIYFFLLIFTQLLHELERDGHMELSHGTHERLLLQVLLELSLDEKVK